MSTLLSMFATAAWNSQSRHLPIVVLPQLPSMPTNIPSSSITLCRTDGTNTRMLSTTALRLILRPNRAMHNRRRTRQPTTRVRATGIPTRAGTRVALKVSRMHQLRHRLPCLPPSRQLTRWHHWHHHAPFNQLSNHRRLKRRQLRQHTHWLPRHHCPLNQSTVLATVNSTVAIRIVEASTALRTHHLHLSSRHRCKRNLWAASVAIPPALTRSTWSSHCVTAPDPMLTDTRMAINCRHTWMVLTKVPRISVL